VTEIDIKFSILYLTLATSKHCKWIRYHAMKLTVHIHFFPL